MKRWHQVPIQETVLGSNEDYVYNIKIYVVFINKYESFENDLHGIKLYKTDGTYLINLRINQCIISAFITKLKTYLKKLNFS